MRDQRIGDVSICDPWVDHRVVLDLLVSSHPTLWTVGELARTICSSAEAKRAEGPGEAAVEDALQELYGFGLVNRSGQFAFATRAAVEFARLRL
jgi:hypothetical protein